MDSILREIVEKRLRRRIISAEPFLEEKIQNFRVLTSEGYLILRVSQDVIRVQTERKVLELCQKKGLKVPEVIFYEEGFGNDKDECVIVEKVEGEPLVLRSLHIFEYNKVLTQLAEFLIKLHGINLAKFGPLRPNLEGIYESWQQFITRDLDMQLEYLTRSQVMPKAIVRNLTYLLHFESTAVLPMLLNGSLSTKSIFVDERLRISAIGDFMRPISGDPGYDLAGFLLSEGFDRAKRLLKSYYLLGGFVEWDSEEFLKTILRRAVGTLYWKVKNNDDISGLKKIMVQLAERLNEF